MQHRCFEEIFECACWKATNVSWSCRCGIFPYDLPNWFQCRHIVMKSPSSTLTNRWLLPRVERCSPDPIYIQNISPSPDLPDQVDRWFQTLCLPPWPVLTCRHCWWLQNLLRLGPCSGNTIHTHPRGSEISTVLYGRSLACVYRLTSWFICKCCRCSIVFQIWTLQSRVLLGIRSSESRSSLSVCLSLSELTADSYYSYIS